MTEQQIAPTPATQDEAPLQAYAQQRPLLVETDWAEEWIRVQRGRKHVDSAERWDKRSVTFGDACGAPSAYTRKFVELLDLQPDDVVFDMGCGTGALAIPLAQAGHKVIARDFSAGMLGRLTYAADQTGTTDLIDAAQMSWEDDWEAAGLEGRFADVAFASRSVITADLGAALTKLSNSAKRYACATISTGYNPMMSPRVLRELGVSQVPAYDYLYTYNVLMQLGYLPEVQFIISDRVENFDSVEEGVEIFAGMLEHARSYCLPEELEAAAKALPAWVEAHLEPNERVGEPDKHGGVEGKYKIVVPDDIRWAFLKWRVQ